MIIFSSKNLYDNSLFYNLKIKLKLFNYDQFKLLWESYLNYCKLHDRVIGTPVFQTGINTINVMSIKQDTEISFNFESVFYNDLLVVQKNTQAGPSFYIYKVTTDPKGKKANIAHLLPGVYASYNIRPHRWISSRPAICQDRGFVKIARTDTNGEVISINPEQGFFGINIHDADAFTNSSLGCTVLEKDSVDNGNHYASNFKPLLQSTIANSKKIDYAVAIYQVLEQLNINNQDITKVNTPVLPLNSYVNVYDNTIPWWSKLFSS